MDKEIFQKLNEIDEAFRKIKKRLCGQHNFCCACPAYTNDLYKCGFYIINRSIEELLVAAATNNLTPETQKVAAGPERETPKDTRERDLNLSFTAIKSVNPDSALICCADSKCNREGNACGVLYGNSAALVKTLVLNMQKNSDFVEVIMHAVAIFSIAEQSKKPKGERHEEITD